MSADSRPKRTDMVDDGVLVALAAARNAVKNVLIVRALRDNADFDEHAYLDVVAAQLRELAAENEADAARVAATIERTKRLAGKSRHPGDFRSKDRGLLKKRRKVLLAVAARLRDQAEDEAAARELLARSRDLALTEINNAAATAYAPRAALEGLERDLALQDMLDELARLKRDPDSPAAG